MERIGFIGLGLMGQPMSRRLLAAGYPVTVWNRTAEKVKALLEAGARWAESARAVAAASDVVFLSLTDAAACEHVVCGPEGILEGAHPSLVIIDASSIGPDAARALASRAAAKGVAMLDAPVSGGPKVAAEGRLGIMVGGPADRFSACKPILEQLGSMILYVGDTGQGVTLKLISNLIMGIAIHASAEALVLAAKAGIDPQLVIDITSVPGTGPQTGAMTTRGPRILKHSFFPPHFSADNMYKDLSAALALADKIGVSLPAATVCREMLRAVKSQGNGHIDSSAVVTILEAMANTRVTPKV
ncbi:MAG TPA: NAD(P)-dependent oxidoreductase [Candidatus Sulfotelmatobacter sp.]|nr:NAD(P)-dependent oxidoreductase [Candidatus Sulfotelmatobacter sp.]